MQEEVDETFDDYEIFFLFEQNEVVFNIYKIARNYFLEDYRLDSTVLVELAKEASTSVTKVLNDIVFIHSGYLDIVLEDINPVVGNESTFDGN